MKEPEKFNRCDCGQPGYKKDGSGWFCSACEKAVKQAETDLAEHIRKTRAKANEEHVEEVHKEKIRKWFSRNKEKRRAYMREYDKKRRQEVNLGLPGVFNKFCGKLA